MSKIHSDEEKRLPGLAFPLVAKVALIIDPEAFPGPITRLDQIGARQADALRKAGAVIGLVRYHYGLPRE